VDGGSDDRLGRATTDGVSKSHISGEGGVGGNDLRSSGTSSRGRSDTRAVGTGSEGSVGVDARVSRDTSAQGSNDRAGSSAGLDGSGRALVCASGERNGDRGSLNRRSDGSDDRRARYRSVAEGGSGRGLVEVAILLTLVLSSVCADCQGGGHEGRAEVHDDDGDDRCLRYDRLGCDYNVEVVRIRGYAVYAVVERMWRQEINSALEASDQRVTGSVKECGV